jgi:Mn-dependent DtxR family transcriptional regulator
MTFGKYLKTIYHNLGFRCCISTNAIAEKWKQASSVTDMLKLSEKVNYVKYQAFPLLIRKIVA